MVEILGTVTPDELTPGERVRLVTQDCEIVWVGQPENDPVRRMVRVRYPGDDAVHEVTVWLWRWSRVEVFRPVEATPSSDSSEISD